MYISYKLKQKIYKLTMDHRLLFNMIKEAQQFFSKENLCAKFLKKFNILRMNIYGALWFKNLSPFFINTHTSISIFVSFYRRIDWSSEKCGFVTTKLQSRSSSLYFLTPNRVLFPCHHVRNIGYNNGSLFSIVPLLKMQE